MDTRRGVPFAWWLVPPGRLRLGGGEDVGAVPGPALKIITVHLQTQLRGCGCHAKQAQQKRGRFPPRAQMRASAPGFDPGQYLVAQLLPMLVGLVFRRHSAFE